MNVENQIPQRINTDLIPEGGDFSKAPKPESTSVDVIEVPTEVNIKVNQGFGETAVKRFVREPIAVEPQPGREPFEIPEPPNLRNVIGYPGNIRH
jgi:hypothetical protein